VHVSWRRWRRKTVTSARTQDVVVSRRTIGAGAVRARTVKHEVLIVSAAENVECEDALDDAGDKTSDLQQKREQQVVGIEGLRG
jgi:hypothetical protein